MFIWSLIKDSTSTISFFGGGGGGEGGRGRGVFNKRIIPLVVVRYEMTIALGNSAVRFTRRVVGSLSSHIQRALVE